ncbi:MAG: hypothetical protein Q9218_003883 [Villophora microphyllina]
MKHQTHDKTIYRRGYVQMLERQQEQLIAGLQAVHRMMQQGKSLPEEPLDIMSQGQPLVHTILQRLGVLDTSDSWFVEADTEEAKRESTLPRFSPTDSTSSHNTLYEGRSGEVSQASTEVLFISPPISDEASSSSTSLPPLPTASYAFPSRFFQEQSIEFSGMGRSTTGPSLDFNAVPSPMDDEYISVINGTSSVSPYTWTPGFDGVGDIIDVDRNMFPLV